jgi:hypothetical protein
MRSPRHPPAEVLRAAALVAAVVVLAGGCGEDAPVARLEVSPPVVELPHGQVRPLTLAWTPTEELYGREGDPLVFVHLLERPGQVLRTFDHPFPRRWHPGTPIRYDVALHQSALAPPLPPGRYKVTVGLYQARGGRWPLETAGQEVDGREYAVAEVAVPASPPAGPRFGFAGPWLEVEPGGDLQMLARRWLAGDGVLTVSNVPGPGSLWMMLLIPEGGGDGRELVLEPGAASPGVTLSGTCSGVETGITGPGPHEVRLPVAAAAGRCDVRFDANFLLQTAGSPQPRTVALEGLGFAPR